MHAFYVRHAICSIAGGGGFWWIFVWPYDMGEVFNMLLLEFGVLSCSLHRTSVEVSSLS